MELMEESKVNIKIGENILKKKELKSQTKENRLGKNTIKSQVF